MGSYLSFQGASELEAWDVGDPSNPVLMGEHLGAGDVVDLALGKGHVFTARFMSGFEIFSLCQGPLFANGFESGDTSAWASATPWDCRLSNLDAMSLKIRFAAPSFQVCPATGAFNERRTPFRR